MLFPISFLRRIMVRLNGPATFFRLAPGWTRISGASFPRATSGARLGNAEQTGNVISGAGDERGPMARPVDKSVCQCRSGCPELLTGPFEPGGFVSGHSAAAGRDVIDPRVTRRHLAVVVRAGPLLDPGLQ